MGKFLNKLFQSSKVPREAQYGIVLITKEPEKVTSRQKQDLAAIKKYPEVVETYTISEQEAREQVPDLELNELPAYALIREGIYSSESFAHRLEYALICSSRPTEVILFIEYMK